ncbi:hypothetical protein N7475_003366 [Penicillium sp. IBT 31633x]|nr:hypothetical protein N7475_003366 [Penicillium sp. IBT 31633x]
MEAFCLPRTRIPQRLYRVQRDNSVTRDVEIGLIAQDQAHFITDKADFGRAVERHVNKCEDSESMFISTFSNIAQAEDWLSRKWRLYGGGAQVLEIDTRYLGHGFVYRACNLVQELGLNTPGTTHDDLHSEYLILHLVPARAIIARRAKMSTSQSETTLIQSPNLGFNVPGAMDRSSGARMPIGGQTVQPQWNIYLQGKVIFAPPPPEYRDYESPWSSSHGSSSRKSSLSSFGASSGTSTPQTITSGENTPRGFFAPDLCSGDNTPPGSFSSQSARSQHDQ